jgi:DNA-binding NarL/FixJ family response regulator
MIVITSDSTERAIGVAYANGAAVCLPNPASSRQLATAIAQVRAIAPHLAAA